MGHPSTAPVTREINKIKALLQEPHYDGKILKELYINVLKRFDTFSEACQEAIRTGPPQDQTDLQVWYDGRIEQFQPTIEAARTFLSAATSDEHFDDSTSRVSIRARSSVSRASTSSSLFRRRLAEEKAKHAADCEFAELEKARRMEEEAMRSKSVELEETRRITVRDKKARELDLLEMELNKLDGIISSNNLVTSEPSTNLSLNAPIIGRSTSDCARDSAARLQPLLTSATSVPVLAPGLWTNPCDSYQTRNGYNFQQAGTNRLESRKLGDVSLGFGADQPAKSEATSNVVSSSQLPNFRSTRGAFGQYPQSSLPPQSSYVSNLGRNVNKNVKAEYSTGVQSAIDATAREMGREIIASQAVRANLPRVNITIFDGSDLTKFNSFLLDFERMIESQCSDDVFRYNHLLQQTAGHPQTLVRSCHQVDATRAYAQAKQILISRYGDQYAIAYAYIAKLRSWPIIRGDNPKALEEYSIYLTSCANISANMTSLNQLNSIDEIMRMASKLPYNLQKSFKYYATSARDKNGSIDFMDLVNFVHNEARVANQAMFHVLDNAAKPTHNVSQDRNKRILSTIVENREGEYRARSNCLYCTNNSSHSTDQCFKFIKLSSQEKLSFIRKHGICYGCLASSKHISAKCTNRLKCSVCKGIHPTSLHRGEFTKVNTASASNYTLSSLDRGSRQEGSGETHTRTLKASTGQSDIGRVSKISHAIVPIRINIDGQEPQFVYAALDGCSTDCWINYDLLDKLGIKSKPATISITTMDRVNCSTVTQLVSNLSISDTQGNNSVTIPFLYARHNWPFDESDVPREQEIKSYKHLSRVPFDFIQAKVELLIGMNMPNLIKPIQVVDSPNESAPYATRHKFGWAFNGPMNHAGQHNIQCFRTKLESYSRLENRIDAYFADDFSEPLVEGDGESVEDREWLSKVEASIKLLSIGKYQIDLPFRHNDLKFPNNINQARNRFKQTQSRFLKNSPEYFNEYRAFMETMFTRNFAERVPSNELHTAAGDCWYLVHHAVCHRVTQKIRVVFDCSLKYNNVSLNDTLLQGPNNINSLLGVLLRFRKHNVALMADIEKMYYQVRVTPKHTNFLRFFWFPGSDPTAEPVEYRVLVHVFGAKSSPSIATYALRRVTMDFQSISAEANISINDHFYVDDFLQSYETDYQAEAGAASVRALLSRGGFNLTGFVSNSRNVLQSFEPNLLAKQVSSVDLFYEDLPSNRALGVIWHIQDDSLSFAMNLESRPVTRRGLLSVSFSLYDPLGLASPAILTPKKLFQESCRLKLEWDDPLPSELANPWNTWLKEAHSLKEYHVPRCYRPASDVINNQLHIFADGSQVAYGAIAFMRSVAANGRIHCVPIMAKSRLTPLSASVHPSIPRIELEGAKLAVKVYNIIKHELKMNFDKICFWTDSSTVLQYIRNNTHRFQRYVANRVAYIRANTNVESWHYVPTGANPADIASRGLNPSLFVQSKLWAEGPPYLYKDEVDWPAPLFIEPLKLDDGEVKQYRNSRVATFVTSTGDGGGLCLIDRLSNSCSDWHKLRRRVAWILRLKYILRNRNNRRTSGSLQLSEIHQAELEICKLVQFKHYSGIIADIKNKTLRAKHRLRKLNPFINKDDDLLRVGGRLRQATSLAYAVQHPIILPNNDPISEQIVRYFHTVKCGHLGRESVRSELRSHYWIERDSTLIRQILKSCIICQKIKGQPMTQLMADLPADRVEGNRPAFYSTGIDIFGPFYVKFGRGSGKRYGIVFSCMASRAIHLEICESMTTDSFICALRRFICRRGQVKIIRCDNGTNLVGAKNELSREIHALNQGDINRELEVKDIEWLFRPPTASHFGGIWEREIRTVRQVLNALLYEQPMKLSNEGLCTLMCEVESILNNRPITPISDDPDDVSAITPNHLLLCHNQTSFPPGLFEKSDTYSRKRWRQVQYLADLFWSKWRKSYLSLMQERQKWFVPRSLVKLGDLVLVVNHPTPRNKWPLGRVCELIPAADELIRKVRVRLGGGNIIFRPISKLIVIQSI